MKRPYVPNSIKSIAELLYWQAENHPNKKAYTFLTSHGQTTLSYSELNLKVQKVAQFLQQHQLYKKTALLIYPSSLDYIETFLGCLCAGVIAIPTYPPHHKRQDKRIQAIIKSAHPQAILTTQKLASNIEHQAEFLPELKDLPCYITDDFDAESITGIWTPPTIQETDCAFLQYTSGSTSSPKGVIVTHENLLANEKNVEVAFDHNQDTVFVGWLPLYHDMGLIGNILQPLYLGIHCTFMSPIDFLKKPFNWLKAISDYKATTSGGPNFAYDLCVNQITDEQKQSLDLSSWKVAFNGAEPIRAETLERFTTAFADCGFKPETFYPCYGMAEATLFITGSEIQNIPVPCHLDKQALSKNQVQTYDAANDKTISLIGCGHTWLDTETKIVNPDTLIECQSDEVGEIWVKGQSVAQGYWSNPEATEQTFQARIANTNEEPFLRTGDLGFIHNNELFITGRLKDIIIIRGRNYYPQDIESTLEKSHFTLKANASAAFSVEINGEEKLIVAVEVERRYKRERRKQQQPSGKALERRHHSDRRARPYNDYSDDIDEPLNTQRVIQTIRHNISEQHDLQVYAVLLLRVGSIPKTTSGKIQRHACRQGFLDGSLNVVGSDILNTVVSEQQHVLTREILLNSPKAEYPSLVGAYIHELICNLLHIPSYYFDWQHSINKLGIDSLIAVELQHRIESNLGVQLPITYFLQNTSIAELVEHILKNLQSLTEAPNHIENITASHPLSYNQQALWFLSKLAPNSAAYNIFFAVDINAPLDTHALQRAFQALAERHPVLRTNYHEQMGQPTQQIDVNSTLDFKLIEVSSWQASAIDQYLTEQAHKAFDLEKDSLMRIRLCQRNDEQYSLLWVIHHICVDLWSMTILLDELQAYYEGYSQDKQVELPSIKSNYIDFAYWQHTMLNSTQGDLQAQYWLERLSGDLPVLDLPLDYPRPSIQTYTGASIGFKLEPKLIQALKAMVKSSGTTLYTLLLAAFQVLLHRYTQQDDILVGSPSAGRYHANFDDVVGYFTNMLVLRGDLSTDISFDEFLTQTQSHVLNALENQHYPFQLLVDKLLQEREPSLSPLFQAAFGLQKPHKLPECAPFVLKEKGANMQLGDLVLETRVLEQKIAQFDMTLLMVETDGSLIGSWEYNSALFKPQTIQRMIEHFEVLLTNIVNQPEKNISTLSMLSEQEHEQLTTRAMAATDYPPQCVHQVFEQQVQAVPNNIAAVFEQQTLSYQQLNQKANQLAHYLQAQGVKPDTLVGLCLERSLDIVVAILGILKAGGAYVPLELAYPDDRLNFILNDAQAPILLTHSSLTDRFSESDSQIVCLDQIDNELAQCPTQNPVCQTTPENLSYVIYTSGSTGNPKGCLIQHHNVTRLFTQTQDWYQFNQNDVWTLFHSYAFDFSVWELWGALLYGGKLVVVPYWVSRSPQDFYQLLQQHKVTVLNQTPSAFYQLMQIDKQSQADLDLRYITFGGEALDIPALKEWFDRHGDQKPQLINMYGITETTVHVTYRPLSRADLDNEASVIGQPIPDLTLYILDQHQNPVPTKVSGEMYVGGLGVARGYLNRDELTAQRFIQNPFNPDEKLYRTGDLARYLESGDVEYLGRIDHQVKIRGFRIELGEIEAAIAQHPQVNECIVLVQNHEITNAKQLIAFIVPQKEQDAQQETTYVDLISQVFQHTYSGSDTDEGATDFNIIGWNSSYTGQEIPAAEMEEWVEDTVERILALQPQKTVEIGCGTGLLLSRVAPQCQAYLGLDLSDQAIDYVALLKQTHPALHHVSLQQAMADDFTAIDKDEYDTVILNSVAQYFPSIQYLTKVLQQAVETVTDGARIFVGDLRNFCLLEHFHASVQLYQATDDTTLADLRQTIDKQLLQEEELLMESRYFVALQQLYPRIQHIEVQPKQGEFDNELTKFRYDVVLHIGQKPELYPVDWQTWSPRWDLEVIRKHLTQNQPEVFGLQRIRNARLVEENTLLQQDWTGTVASFKTPTDAVSAINPQALYQLANELDDYQVEISWLEMESSGHFAAVFKRNHVQGLADFPALAATQEYAAYASSPLQHSSLYLQSLKQSLQKQLPDYMNPAHYVTLEQMPLTPNGKADRKALLNMDIHAGRDTADLQPAQNQVEQILVDIWQEVLNIQPIGINDNFFALGGDSILSIQVVARANQQKLKLTPRLIFQYQTIAELAAVIEISEGIQAQQGAVTGEVLLTPIQSWFFEQDLANKHYYNQSVLLNVASGAQTTLLEQAIQHLVQYHDALRLQFKQQDGQWQQYDMAEVSPVQLDVVSFNSASDPSIEAITQQAQASLNIETPQLLKAVFLQDSHGQNDYLFIAIHHLAVDGMSWRILLNDLSQLYQQLLQQESMQLPEKTTAYQDWAKCLQKYAPTSAQHLDFWTQRLQLATGKMPTDFNPELAANTVQSSAEITALLTKTQTTDLLQNISQAYNTQINDILLAALALTVSNWTQQPSIHFDLESHGRELISEEIDLSRTVGWFTSLYPVVLQTESSTDLETVIKSVKEQLRQIPDNGISFGILRYLSEDQTICKQLSTSPQAQLSFNYLGQFDQNVQSGLFAGLSTQQTAPYHDPQNQRPYLLDFNLMIVDEQLHVTCTYSQAFHRTDTIQQLVTQYVNQLQVLIEHCLAPQSSGYTPSDFPEADLSQDDLDNLLEQL
ncbi:amino acid adenylation domain-containing protein [Candidatus Albibeggiatoa sp. nov. NOAA]|uniref:amino acid adenylation domain-containing protein n=1 Tax=Candidatus Albibeggiatoa sp. nov. NOAA TaxID=3162724 RepID=UPI0032F1C8ED|nr:amino acid adenylation domain-containing protein [Thiotrichaceae bacterium]